MCTVTLDANQLNILNDYPVAITAQEFARHLAEDLKTALGQDVTVHWGTPYHLGAFWSAPGADDDTLAIIQDIIEQQHNYWMS